MKIIVLVKRIINVILNVKLEVMDVNKKIVNKNQVIKENMLVEYIYVKENVKNLSSVCRNANFFLDILNNNYIIVQAAINVNKNVNIVTKNVL
jgi:hypothetical protein